MPLPDVLAQRRVSGAPLRQGGALRCEAQRNGRRPEAGALPAAQRVGDIQFAAATQEGALIGKPLPSLMMPQVLFDLGIP